MSFNIPNAICVFLISFFTILGLFGNGNLAVAVSRKKHAKEMRTKIVLMMTFTTSLQSLCILYEFGGLFQNWLSLPVKRSVCFYYSAPYLLSSLMQNCMFFAVSLDMLLSITVPFRHHVWSTRRYVGSMCFASFLISSIVLIACYFGMNDDVLDECTLPVVIPTIFIQYIGYFFLFTIVGCISTVLIGMCIVLRQGSKSPRSSKREQSAKFSSPGRKALGRLLSSVTVYIGPWCISICMILLMTKYDVGGKWTDWPKRIVTVLPMITYSQTFYMGYFRLPVQRKVFREQLNLLTFGKYFKETESDVKTVLQQKFLITPTSPGRNSQIVVEF